jgi:hypothetical protein
MCHHLGLHCGLLGMTSAIVTDFFNKKPLELGRCHPPPFSTLWLAELLSEIES